MLGIQFISALCTRPDGVQRFLKMDARPEWFVGTDQEVYDRVHNHISLYGAFPSTEAMAGLSYVNTTEDAGYYLDLLENEYIHSVIASGITSVAAELNATNLVGATEALKNTLVHCMRSTSGNRIMDYATDGSDFVMDQVLAKKKGLIPKVPIPWAKLNALVGGATGGDLISIVGRPANGKSFLIMWWALKAWEAGFTPLIISMEMNHLAIAERFVSMQAPIYLTNLKRGLLGNAKMEILNKQLTSNKSKGPLWVVDGALAATVEDVVMYSQHLKPDIVFIDGAYLLRSNENVARHERVTSNLEILKGDVAERLNIPAVVSYQFNREAAKKFKKGENAGLEDISYTDAVGQLSSVVLGMLEDDNIKTTHRRAVSILKGRDGQSGEFGIKWQFEPHLGLDFQEVDLKTKPTELNHV